MIDQMTHLFRLRAVIEEGSMRKAAGRLNLTQPALSRSIAQLESIFGRPLLVRHTRGIEPTDFGLRVLSTVNRMSRQWELAQEDLMRTGRETTGVLRLRTGPLWRSVVLPSILPEFQVQFPGVDVVLEYASPRPVLEDLIEGHCDISFGGVQIDAKRDKRLIRREFVTVRDRIVARRDHPLLADLDQDGFVRAPHLLDYPWIVYTGDSVYELQTQHAMIERLGRAPLVRCRSESLLAVLGLLQRSDYLCILPEASVHATPEMQLRALPLPWTGRVVPSGAVYRAEMADWPPLVGLLDIATKYFANDAPEWGAPR